MVFTVTLSSPAETTISVQYNTADGTATAGMDYTTTSGTLTFSVGQTSQTIGVPILGDEFDESNETFTLMLSNAYNATIDDGQATGTIRDDDGSGYMVFLPLVWR